MPDITIKISMQSGEVSTAGPEPESENSFQIIPPPEVSSEEEDGYIPPVPETVEGSVEYDFDVPVFPGEPEETNDGGLSIPPPPDIGEEDAGVVIIPPPPGNES